MAGFWNWRQFDAVKTNNGVSGKQHGWVLIGAKYVIHRDTFSNVKCLHFIQHTRQCQTQGTCLQVKAHASRFVSGRQYLSLRRTHPLYAPISLISVNKLSWKNEGACNMASRRGVNTNSWNEKLSYFIWCPLLWYYRLRGRKFFITTFFKSVNFYLNKLNFKNTMHKPGIMACYVLRWLTKNKIKKRAGKIRRVFAPRSMPNTLDFV